MDAYSLVILGKQKQGISSDRAFALANDLTVQNISDWKAGRAKPSAANFLKVAKAAGMSIEEALEYALKMEAKPIKQAGHISIPMISLISGLSLSAMTHSPIAAAVVTIVSFGHVYYVKWQERYLPRQSQLSCIVFEPFCCCVIIEIRQHTAI